MSEVAAQYITPQRFTELMVLEDESTHEQLLNRVRSLARQLAEAKAALAASESRENDLMDRIRGGL